MSENAGKSQRKRKNLRIPKYTEVLCFKVLVFGDLTVRRRNIVQNTRCCGSGAVLCRTAVTIISARSATTAIIAVVTAVSAAVIAAATVIASYVALAALRADHNVTGKVFTLAPG